MRRQERRMLIVKLPKKKKKTLVPVHIKSSAAVTTPVFFHAARRSWCARDNNHGSGHILSLTGCLKFKKRKDAAGQLAQRTSSIRSYNRQTDHKLQRRLRSKVSWIYDPSCNQKMQKDRGEKTREREKRIRREFKVISISIFWEKPGFLLRVNAWKYSHSIQLVL